MLRRDFLTLCGSAGLGLATPLGLPSNAVARTTQSASDPYDGPYYIVFNASGGWDTTYMMDPKGVNGINRLFKEGDIQTHGAHVFAPIKKHVSGGMSNEEFFKKYGKELLVFNGLDYSAPRPSVNESPIPRILYTPLDFFVSTSAFRNPSELVLS